MPAATVIDYMTPNGFIALQVHAVPEYRKMRIAWRNIRLCDLGLNPDEGDVIDPNLSEWKDASTGWLAQVCKDRESGAYKVNLSDEPYANKQPVAVLTGRMTDEGLLFENEAGCTGRIVRKRLLIEGDDLHFNGQQIHRVSPTLGAEAPEGALVLFDGSNLDAWGAVAHKEWLHATGEASEAVRIAPGGVIEMIPGKGSILTRRTFRDYHLHLEFRLLGPVTNGGVYLQSRSSSTSRIRGASDRAPRPVPSATSPRPPTPSRRSTTPCRRWSGRRSTSTSGLRGSTPRVPRSRMPA